MGDYLHACAKNNGLPLPDKELQRFLPWNYKNTINTSSPKNVPESIVQHDEMLNPVPVTISILPEQTILHAHPPPGL